jgi:hypothetical protein
MAASENRFLGLDPQIALDKISPCGYEERQRFDRIHEFFAAGSIQRSNTSLK